MGEVAGHAESAAKGGWGVRVLLASGIVLGLAVQLWLIFVQEFNWDEFYFLALVHDYLRGNLDKALQTIHVHLFAPLSGLPGREVEQLIGGRLAMLAFEGATLVSLYVLARRWTSPAAALLAAFAFAAMPATLQHGASFRADPLALALSMVALAVLATARLGPVAVVTVALLLALSALVTVKVVFFAPAFAGIAAWRIACSRDRDKTVRALATAAAAAVVGGGVIYYAHQAALGADFSTSGEMVTSAGSTTILNSGLLPRRLELIQWALAAPVQAVLILASAIALGLAFARDRGNERWLSVAMLGCIAPLASLLFYRNAFPYFFPFIIAPAFVAVAWFVHRHRPGDTALGVLAAAMLATAVLALPRIASRGQEAQRSVISAVHRIFPQPVAYIDRSSMIATFPKQGFFMSTWGMLDYQKRAPIFRSLLAEQSTPLLIANGPALEHAIGETPSLPKALTLHPEDRRILQENFIQHWGPLWVAGKRTRLDSGGADLEILIPGTYTLEGEPVTLDGRKLEPGQAVMLDRGTYRVSGRPGSGVILRWGDHLYRPAEAHSANPIFRGF